jgi:hypothetical protein
MKRRMIMRIFILGKTYKLTLMIDDKLSYFTATILDEDDTHFKFIDKYGIELTKSKDTIKSSEEVRQ